MAKLRKDILGFITARGGSKGIYRKNLTEIGGKPLIQWTIETALNSNEFDRVIVSTDDEEITEVSLKLGAEVPFKRPDKFSTDKASHSDTILHALKWLYKNEGYNPGQVMLLQPTSPLRSIDDIHQSIIKFSASQARSLVSVTESHHHPHLMNEIIDDRLVPFIQTGNFPGMESIRRQELPGAYVVNGAIYMVEVGYFLENKSLVSEETLPFIMPLERSHQIDTLGDLGLVDFLIRSNIDYADS